MTAAAFAAAPGVAPGAAIEVRAVDGAGLWAVRTDIALLLATTAVFLVVGVRFFRWE